MPEHTNNIPLSPESQSSLAELDVLSDEVQEIIGRPPNSVVRWGVTAFFIVLLLILLSTWFVKYPEVIEAPLRLTAINAPKILESRVNGKLVHLQVENNTEVGQGQVLAWLESTAGHETVLELSAGVDSMRIWLLDGNMAPFRSLQLGRFSDLGPLQAGFQTFEQAYREFVSFLSGGFHHRQREVLVQELDYTRLLLEKLTRQKEIQQAENDLAEREYRMKKQLADQELIAPIELARKESNLLSRLLPLQQTEAAIINNHMSQAAKQQEILELDRRIAEQQSVFLQAVNTLKSAIDDWKANHLITAPFSGRLTYAGILQENQSLAAGQEMFYIQPENTDFFGELAISQQSFGKIEKGQQVLVRFSGYPHHEFGTVEGHLDYLSGFPVRDSVFLGKVSFPRGLQTNYKQQLSPRNGMTGQAEIITRDMRLMERVTNNIKKELR